VHRLFTTLVFLVATPAGASIDGLDLLLVDKEGSVVTTYGGADTVASPPPDEPAKAAVRLGAVSIDWTQHITEDHAYDELSRLLRQRSLHLDHCATHTDSTDLQLSLTFADPPRVRSTEAPGLAACVETLAARWPVPDRLAGVRASVRVVVEKAE